MELIARLFVPVCAGSYVVDARSYACIRMFDYIYLHIKSNITIPRRQCCVFRTADRSRGGGFVSQGLL